MSTVALVGHLCLDLAPRFDQAPQLVGGGLQYIDGIAATLGGMVGNTGRTLSALRVPVHAVFATGDDAFRELMVDLVERQQWLMSTEQTRAATSASVIVEHGGADRTIWHAVGANADFTPPRLDASGHTIVHVGYPALLPQFSADGGRPLAEFFAACRRDGATTSLDLSVVDRAADPDTDWAGILDRVLAETDVITPSFDDLASALSPGTPRTVETAGAFADRLVAAGAAVAIVSLGADGVVLRTGKRERLARAGRALAAHADAWADRAAHHPAPPLGDDVVTTNGAGDAFTGGVLGGLVRELGPDATVALGLERARLAVLGRAESASATG